MGLCCDGKNESFPKMNRNNGPATGDCKITSIDRPRDGRPSRVEPSHESQYYEGETLSDAELRGHSERKRCLELRESACKRQRR